MVIEEKNMYVYLSVDNETLNLSLRVVEKIDEIIINL
jgi:hypothetical protein